MAHLTTDLFELYRTYFQQPYCVPLERVPEGSYATKFSQPLRKELATGVEVFLPVVFRGGGVTLEVACATVRAASRTTVVRTAVAERRGTVKELYMAGDWEFTVKGVLIAANGIFPDEEVDALRRIYETAGTVEMENALSDLFLDGGKGVCITSLEFPGVEGRTGRHRPFTLMCESDFITSL